MLRSQKPLRRPLGACAVLLALAVPLLAQGEGDNPFEIRIGPGDLIGIEVFGLPELDQELRVALDGTVSMPLVGGFPVDGQTAEEAARTIRDLLVEKQLVVDPEVSVAIKESVNSGVSVQGAVGRPGVFQLPAPKSVLEILLEAGGLSANSARTIFVLREAPDGSQTRIEIDAERLVDQADMSVNVDLRPGDVVLVPEAKSHRVYVSGAVRSPGPISFSSGEGITLLQAITAAGGPTERANLGKVQVIRRLPDGSEERFFVNVKRIRGGKVEDFALERNDTIVVKEWFF